MMCKTSKYLLCFLTAAFILTVCNILLYLPYMHWVCTETKRVYRKEEGPKSSNKQVIISAANTSPKRSVDLATKRALTIRPPGINAFSYRCKEYAEPFAFWKYDWDVAWSNMVAFYDHYQPKDEIVTDVEFQYIVPGENICRGSKAPLIVILVLSTIKKHEERTTIRETWGMDARTRDWSSDKDRYSTIKVVFLLGRAETNEERDIVNKESRLYGDVVQADFVDSYFNLTLKVLTGLRWVSEYCSNSKYAMKTDTDMYVHLPNLANLLRLPNVTEAQECGLIIGYLNFQPEVLREGKWAVSKDIYPMDYYPSYGQGNGYIITTDVTASMFDLAKHIPFLNIEDVFVTGVLRSLLAVNLYSHTGLSHWYESVSLPCDFKSLHRITATNMDEEKMRALYYNISNNFVGC